MPAVIAGGRMSAATAVHAGSQGAEAATAAATCDQGRGKGLPEPAQCSTRGCLKPQPQQQTDIRKRRSLTFDEGEPDVIQYPVDKRMLKHPPPKSSAHKLGHTRTQLKKMKYQLPIWKIRSTAFVHTMGISAKWNRATQRMHGCGPWSSLVRLQVTWATKT